MNGSLKRTDYVNFEYEQVDCKPVAENCNFSGFSMAAVAGGILLCVGIVIYALLTV